MVDKMILLDSSFLVAYLLETDRHHPKSFDIMQKIKAGAFGAAYITDYIFDEVVTVTMARSKNLHKAIEAGTYLKESLPILKLEEESLENAWNIFRFQSKAVLSFTDCTNLSEMTAKGIENLATFDEGFMNVKGIKVVN